MCGSVAPVPDGDLRWDKLRAGARRGTVRINVALCAGMDNRRDAVHTSGPGGETRKMYESGLTRGGDVGDPVKDEALEVPVPEVWRPTLEAVVDSLVRRDSIIGAGLPALSPVSADTTQ